MVAMVASAPSLERPFVGRGAELEALAAVVSSARAGGGALLVVRGEAGIGKTTLIEAAARAADGSHVIRVCGHETESELPFVALADALRPFADRVASLPARQRATLESVLAIGTPRRVRPLSVYAALLDMCSELVGEAPLVVIVDDAHWLDDATRDALLFVARRLDDAGIAFVVATRDSDDAWSALHAVEIPLGGLGLEETLLLLGALGHFSDRVAGEVHELAGGNPLAVLTALDLLSAAQRVGAEPLEDPLRSGTLLEDVLRQRAAKLDARTGAALVVVAAATGDDAAEIGSALRELGLDLSLLHPAEQSAIVTLEPGRVSFVHPLYRSAIYHGAPAAERRAAHRALAAALGSDRDRVRRAHHLAEATIEPDEAIAAELASVALELAERAAHPQAGVLLVRAAALSPDPADRARRLVLASDAMRERGDAVRAAELAEAAGQAALAPRDRASADAALGRALMLTGPMDGASELLAAAAAELADSDRPEAARLLVDASDASFSAGNDERAQQLARRAARLMRGTDAPERYAALALDAFANTVRGEVGSASRLIAVILRNRDQTTRDERVVAAVGPLLLATGHYHEAAEYAEVVAAHAREDGRLPLLVDALRNLAQARVFMGHFQDAAAVGSTALPLAEGSGQLVQACGLLINQTECAAWAGDEESFARYSERGSTLARELDLRFAIPQFEKYRGFLALGQDRLADAVSSFEEALAEMVSHYGHGLHATAARLSTELAEALIQLGRPETAEQHLDEIADRAVTKEFASVRSVEARCRGLLAAAGDFDEHFQRSLELQAEFDDDSVRGRNHLAYGIVLRRAKRVLEARDQLRTAGGLLERCGMWPWLRRARAEIRAAGGAALRSVPAAGEALTPQEHQVALLVASGATNREVGGALFLSVKTVEAHLSRGFRKLHVSNRRELARRLAQPPDPGTRVSV